MGKFVMNPFDTESYNIVTAQLKEYLSLCMKTDSLDPEIEQLISDKVIPKLQSVFIKANKDGGSVDFGVEDVDGTPALIVNGNAVLNYCALDNIEIKADIVNTMGLPVEGRDNMSAAEVIERTRQVLSDYARIDGWAYDNEDFCNQHAITPHYKSLDAVVELFAKRFTELNPTTTLFSTNPEEPSMPSATAADYGVDDFVATARVNICTQFVLNSTEACDLTKSPEVYQLLNEITDDDWAFENSMLTHNGEPIYDIKARVTMERPKVNEQFNITKITLHAFHDENQSMCENFSIRNIDEHFPVERVKLHEPFMKTMFVERYHSIKNLYFETDEIFKASRAEQALEQALGQEQDITVTVDPTVDVTLDSAKLSHERLYSPEPNGVEYKSVPLSARDENEKNIKRTLEAKEDSVNAIKESKGFFDKLKKKFNKKQEEREL